MITKNPMQLKAFIKNKAAEKHISAQLVIPFRRLWTQLWCKRKEDSLWVGWQRRARLWRLGFSLGLAFNVRVLETII